ncbi:MAG: 50S ribosomal protein L21 [Candidatus Zixiibacteriota bacterium]
MYAIMETGGLQFNVQEGDKIKIPKLDLEPGKKFTFEKILLIGGQEKPVVGTPYVEGAKIEAQVTEQGKSDKIIVFKFKRRTKYRRKKGHRQTYTEVLIKKINLPKS